MKIKVTYLIFMFLPLAVTGGSLIFMPDEVPTHYGADFTADRWGSKLELLIIPVAFMAIGLVMLLLARLAYNAESGNNNNGRITLAVGLALLIAGCVINFFFLYTAYNGVTDLKSLPIDILSLLMVLFGTVFLITGNIMPKAKMNSLLGFRIPWTMKNEDVWKKNQLFAGAVFMIVGILLIIGCLLFFKGLAALFYMLGLLAVMIAVDIAYSYHVLKDSEK